MLSENEAEPSTCATTTSMPAVSTPTTSTPTISTPTTVMPATVTPAPIIPMAEVSSVDDVQTGQRNLDPSDSPVGKRLTKGRKKHAREKKKKKKKAAQRKLEKEKARTPHVSPPKPPSSSQTTMSRTTPSHGRYSNTPRDAVVQENARPKEPQGVNQKGKQSVRDHVLMVPDNWVESIRKTATEQGKNQALPMDIEELEELSTTWGQYHKRAIALEKQFREDIVSINSRNVDGKSLLNFDLDEVRYLTGKKLSEEDYQYVKDATINPGNLGAAWHVCSYSLAAAVEYRKVQQVLEKDRVLEGMRNGESATTASSSDVEREEPKSKLEPTPEPDPTSESTDQSVLPAFEMMTSELFNSPGQSFFPMIVPTSAGADRGIFDAASAQELHDYANRLTSSHSSLEVAISGSEPCAAVAQYTGAKADKGLSNAVEIPAEVQTDDTSIDTAPTESATQTLIGPLPAANNVSTSADTSPIWLSKSFDRHVQAYSRKFLRNSLSDKNSSVARSSLALILNKQGPSIGPQLPVSFPGGTAKIDIVDAAPAVKSENEAMKAEENVKKEAVQQQHSQKSAKNTPVSSDVRLKGSNSEQKPGYMTKFEQNQKTAQQASVTVSSSTAKATVIVEPPSYTPNVTIKGPFSLGAIMKGSPFEEQPPYMDRLNKIHDDGKRLVDAGLSSDSRKIANIADTTHHKGTASITSKAPDPTSYKPTLSTIIKGSNSENEPKYMSPFNKSLAAAQEAWRTAASNTPLPADVQDVQEDTTSPPPPVAPSPRSLPPLTTTEALLRARDLQMEEVGIHTIKDFFKLLNNTRHTSCACKVELITAFTTLSNMERKELDLGPAHAQSAEEIQKSRRAQHKIKLGTVKLVEFLKAVGFEQDGTALWDAVVKGLVECVKLDAKNEAKGVNGRLL